MVDVVNEVRYGARSLIRARGYTAPVAATVALGAAMGGPVLAMARGRLAQSAPSPVAPGWDRAPGGGWTDALLTPEMVQGRALDALALIAMAVTLLVVAGAAVNLATLVLSRGTARRQEIAVRAALGAAPWLLIRQALTEGALLGAAGGALGVLLGAAAGPVMRGTWPGGLDLLAGFRPGTGLVAAAGGLAAGVLLFSLLPALSGARRNLVSALATGARATAGPAEGLFRKVLTVLQFAASAALLTGAVLLVRGSVPNAGPAALGFDPRDTLTLTIELPPGEADRAAVQQQLMAEFGRLPGVTAASASSPGAWLALGPADKLHTRCSRCLMGGLATPILVGAPRHHAVSPGYFRSMGIPVLKGREFGPGDGASGVPVAVVNQRFAVTLLPRAETVGQRVSFTGAFGQLYEVVGVVGDPRPRGLGSTTAPEPAVYVSTLQQPPRELGIALRTGGDPLRHEDAVRGVVSRTAPGARVRDVMTMESVLDRHRAPLRWFAVLLAALAAGALALSAGGLYGVMTFMVARRTREIGIRMALGAAERDVTRQIVGEALRITLWGAGIGGLGAVTLARILQVQFQGVRPLDPLSYLLVAILLGAVTLGAAYVPARRATRVDPMVALRAE